MSKMNPIRLFSEIRKSPFVKKYYTQTGRLEVYFSDLEDYQKGKPTLVRTVNKSGTGKEQLYDSDGKPLLDVELKNGYPHGRARMYDDDGDRIFPNTYWYYGTIVSVSYKHFSEFEDEEKELIKQHASEEQKNNIYKTEEFNSRLEIIAAVAGLDEKTLPILKNRHSSGR